METQTIDRPFDFEDAPTETVPGLDVEALADPHGILYWLRGRPPTPDPGLRRLWSNLGRWVIAVTAATTPVGYFDIRQELRRSGASSFVWSAKPRRGRPISLREAREMAFAILANTERQLEEERSSEARFFLELWDDEALTSA